MEPNCFGIIKGEQPLVCNGDDRGQRPKTSPGRGKMSHSDKRGNAGRSCWGSGLQDASAAQGTKQTQGAATRRLPRLESSRDLAALNTRHLLCKPVCGLKAPLGLSCPAGTAVLSGTLLCVQKSTYSAVMPFAKAIESAPRDYALHRKHFPHTKRPLHQMAQQPLLLQ